MKETIRYKRKSNRPEYEKITQIIKKLWAKPEREYQYFATELVERYEKKFQEDIIDLFEYMITHKSWWDTVDRISKNLVGSYFIKFPNKRDQYLKLWLDSNNIWLQRTCILFQLAYKENTDYKLLFDIITELKGIDEFFIQKAIGWALREYSKVDVERVKDFIENHELSPLSKREGLKYINKEK